MGVRCVAVVLAVAVAGGCAGGRGKTGDGSGVLTQLPRKLLVREAERRGFRVDRPSDLALGMVFLPHHDLVARDLCTALVDHAPAGGGRSDNPELLIIVTFTDDNGRSASTRATARIAR